MFFGYRQAFGYRRIRKKKPQGDPYIWLQGVVATIEMDTKVAALSTVTTGEEYKGVIATTEMDTTVANLSTEAVDKNLNGIIATISINAELEEI